MCECDDNKIVQLENQVAEMQDILTEIATATKFLTCGHPILLINKADDIASFDSETGEGSDCWEGWAMCIGKTHKDSKGKAFTTDNLTERFVVMAGGEYAVGATGGERDHILTVAELASHNHTGTNTHTHTVTDPGHIHAVTDPGHTHTSPPHDHGYGDEKPSVPNAGVLLANFTGGGPDTLGDALSLKTTDPTAATVDSEVTGLTVDSEVTGLTVDQTTSDLNIAEAGENAPHENRPPFYAAFYIQKIG